MKAKLEIPKGWRRLKAGTKTNPDDRRWVHDTVNLYWEKVIAPGNHVLAGEWATVIRKVKK